MSVVGLVGRCGAQFDVLERAELLKLLLLGVEGSALLPSVELNSNLGLRSVLGDTL